MKAECPGFTDVIMADEPISSILLFHPDLVLVMDASIIDKNVDRARASMTAPFCLELRTLKSWNGINSMASKSSTMSMGPASPWRPLAAGIPNGSMLGALAATGIVKIESIEKAILDFFSKKAGEKNAEAARRAYARIKKM